MWPWLRLESRNLVYFKAAGSILYVELWCLSPYCYQEPCQVRRIRVRMLHDTKLLENPNLRSISSRGIFQLNGIHGYPLKKFFFFFFLKIKEASVTPWTPLSPTSTRSKASSVSPARSIFFISQALSPDGETYNEIPTWDTDGDTPMFKLVGRSRITVNAMAVINHHRMGDILCESTTLLSYLGQRSLLSI